MVSAEPANPGLMILHDCLQAHDVSVAEAAERTGINQEELQGVLDGKVRVSAWIAVRLEREFGGSAEVWCRAQSDLSVAQARTRLEQAETGERAAQEAERRLWFLDPDWEPTATPAQSAALGQFHSEIRRCPDCANPRRTER